MNDYQALLLLASFVFALIAAWSIIMPFFSAGSGRHKQVPSRSTAALAEKRDLLFRELEELEFDYRSNRISEEDYSRARGRLSAAVAEVLAGLDRGAEGTEADGVS